MASVAFIGLGVMGYPMAGHLAKKGGHDVTVYNRTDGARREMGGGVRRRAGQDAAGGRRGQGFRLLLRRQ